MLSPITIRYEFRPAQRSLSTGQVADLFGLSESEPAHLIADNITLDIRPDDIVLFTGPSGSGKSSLLRAAGKELGAIDAMALELPDLPLVDALSGPISERLDRLSACGLSEARLLLRRPSELSDGQRYRFRLAYALGECEELRSLTLPARQKAFVMADEFAAYLDRTLAKGVAFNLNKLAKRAKIGLLLATTHEDLTKDLKPDLWVRCHGEGNVEAVRLDSKKKNRSASPMRSGCPKVPGPTGRTSLGGIIAATISRSSSVS